MAIAGIIGDITTGNIDILHGGLSVEIGNKGMSTAQLKAIFGSLAAERIAETKAKTKRSKSTNIVLGLLGTTFIVSTAIFFYNK